MRGQDIKIRDSMAHHLEDLMLDYHMYEWEKVRAFNGVFLNQMEQGHLSWADFDQILKFSVALPFSPSCTPHSSTSHASHIVRIPGVLQDSRGIQWSSQARHGTV